MTSRPEFSPLPLVADTGDKLIACGNDAKQILQADYMKKLAAELVDFSERLAGAGYTIKAETTASMLCFQCCQSLERSY